MYNKGCLVHPSPCCTPFQLCRACAATSHQPLSVPHASSYGIIAASQLPSSCWPVTGDIRYVRLTFLQEEQQQLICCPAAHAVPHEAVLAPSVCNHRANEREQLLGNLLHTADIGRATLSQCATCTSTLGDLDVPLDFWLQLSE